MSKRSNGELNTPDYYKSYTDSKILANKVQAYWHNKGYTGVRAWVEDELSLTDDSKSYTVRSNISFNCNDIVKDLFNGKK